MQRSIGGNHLIHACRRNLDVTMIVVNNLTFGMTGGQVAPTTPKAAVSTTTPFGNEEQPFDLCKLAIAAGATFVSRWNTSRSTQAVRAIKKALQHRGFSLVEIDLSMPDPVRACSHRIGRSHQIAGLDRGVFHHSGRGKEASGTGGCKEVCPWELRRETRTGLRRHFSLSSDGGRVMQKGRVNIQFCGFGGQGIILSSVILGAAAVTKAGLNAVQTQSYGSEARGGECQAEVIVSNTQIDSVSGR